MRVFCASALSICTWNSHVDGHPRSVRVRMLFKKPRDRSRHRVEHIIHHRTRCAIVYLSVFGAVVSACQSKMILMRVADSYVYFFIWVYCIQTTITIRNLKVYRCSKLLSKMCDAMLNAEHDNTLSYPHNSILIAIINGYLVLLNYLTHINNYYLLNFWIQLTFSVYYQTVFNNLYLSKAQPMFKRNQYTSNLFNTHSTFPIINTSYTPFYNRIPMWLIGKWGFFLFNNLCF